MTVVVSIRFKDSGRIYYFDPGNLDLRQGEMVVVETLHGPEIARVVYENFDIPESDISGELKPVLRRAVSADFESAHALQDRHDEVMRICAAKIREHNLPMHLVKAEYNFDASRLTFYFTSEQRVDFRLLVRDLAYTFKTRIELRQIGPRDEARLLGGIGICGCSLCCATFLPNYARVNVKMAKDQDLPLNPSKISGVCGRLLCCLSYEHQQYLELREGLPKRGTWVQTPDGIGEVMDLNILGQVVTVQFAHSGMQEHYRVCQVRETTPPGERQTRRKRKVRGTVRAPEAAEEDTEQAVPHSISEVLGMLDQDMLSFEEEDVTADPDDAATRGTGSTSTPSGRSSPPAKRSSRSQKPASSRSRRGQSQAQATANTPGEAPPASASRKRPARRSRKRSSDQKARGETPPAASTAQEAASSPARESSRASPSKSSQSRRRRKRKSSGNDPHRGE
jgi:cell fate regulator YaaT (PSP1 superfamily)